jgi:hypothetical protein
MPERLEIRQIRTDGGTQPRAGIDYETVADYAHDLKDGAVFPPVVVFHDGQEYWLADGFHRVAAFKHEGKQRIPAEIRQGTLRDAQLYAVGANAQHGLRRSREDKRRAVTMLLEDAEWGMWSDREIARRCKVSNTFVGNLRRELGLTVNVDSETSRKYVTKHGTEAVMHVTASLKTAVKKHIMARLNTIDPAVLASHARAVAASMGDRHLLMDAITARGIDTSHEALTAVLTDLAQEWQASVPPPPDTYTPRKLALLSFLDTIRLLPEADRKLVTDHIARIKEIFDPTEQIYAYAEAFEELLNEI